MATQISQVKYKKPKRKGKKPEIIHLFSITTEIVQPKVEKSKR
jgi:hypothetical protein